MPLNVVVQDTKSESALSSLSDIATYRPNWVPASPVDLDVAIIGGGQSGIAAAFALRRAGIHRTQVFDAAPAEQVGTWRSIARMKTLRTVRDISGPEQGVTELSFRHWFTEKHGSHAYATLGRIPRQVWADYLDWFRVSAAISVAYETRLLKLGHSRDNIIKLIFETPNGILELTTRKLVLATGISGFGGPWTPPEIAAAVPESLRVHTQDQIDTEIFRNRKVGVVGAGASAFDNAIIALENGATSVHQFVRHSDLADAPDGSSHAILTPERLFFPEFSDDARWQLITRRRLRGSPPPWTVELASSFSGHHLHYNVDATKAITTVGNEIHVQANGKTLRLDILIVATGYRQDVKRRPELSSLADDILLWKHVLPVAPEHEHWGEYPHVGTAFELHERVPGTAPWLANIHLYTFAAIINHGTHIGDISSSPLGLPRLVAGIVSDFGQSSRAGFEAAAMASLAARAQVANGLVDAALPRQRVGA